MWNTSACYFAIQWLSCVLWCFSRKGLALFNIFPPVKTPLGLRAIPIHEEEPAEHEHDTTDSSTDTSEQGVRSFSGRWFGSWDWRGWEVGGVRVGIMLETLLRLGSQ